MIGCGVVLMKGEYGLRCVIDWLSFVVSADFIQMYGNIKEALAVFGIEGIDFRDRGLFGYKNSASVWGDGLIGFGGHSQNGTVLVSLPSGALSVMSSKISWVEFFSCLREFSDYVTITRFDIAIDEKRELSSPMYLDFYTIFYHLQSDLIKTKLKRKTFQVIQNFNSEAWTFYLGRRTSQVFVRIYNKAVEQGLSDCQWVRFEVEFKKVRAQQVFDAFYNSGFDTSSLAGSLFSVVSFVLDDDTNVSRRSCAPWWIEFINGVEVVPLPSLPERESTLLKRHLWLASMSRAIAAVVAVSGVDFFSQIADSGMQEILTSEKDLRKYINLLDDWQELGGYDALLL
jgi:DNA relaxase NicK